MSQKADDCCANCREPAKITFNGMCCKCAQGIMSGSFRHGPPVTGPDDVKPKLGIGRVKLGRRTQP